MPTATPAATELPTLQERIDFVKEWIADHLVDSRKLHLPFLGQTELSDFLTRHEVILFLVGGIILLLFVALYRREQRVPRGLTNALEAVIVFIRDDICIAAMGEEDGRRFTPFFCTMFFLIVGCNLIGLTPAFPTVTANISVTTALATLIFLLLTVGAVIKLRGPVNFVKAFITPGVPWPLLLLTVPLDLIGICLKCCTLAIRLFANMLAGHIIIMAFIGMLAVFGYLAVPAFFVALAIDLLEVLIAVLQAYIFVLLAATFIGQTYHPAH